jgi:hypothetical protein
MLVSLGLQEGDPRSLKASRILQAQHFDCLDDILIFGGLINQDIRINGDEHILFLFRPLRALAGAPPPRVALVLRPKECSLFGGSPRPLRRRLSFLEIHSYSYA